jgi:hypothetical protein
MVSPTSGFEILSIAVHVLGTGSIHWMKGTDYSNVVLMHSFINIGALRS